ncbi:MAG: glycosyltransferase [Peptostreptococcus sp.]|uniref:glycosyltransferase n=1 Tax=Peptostreptococcus sp. TaxID=1262 RepID=UPI002FC62E57
MYSQILYIIGFTLIIIYILMGIDDFIWDLISLTKIKKKDELNFYEIDKLRPKMFAIVIAAWSESDVIYDVVENLIESQKYPKSMYKIFLGVYPNDQDTIEAVKKIQEKYKNVNCIINYKNGPTSKAQNINYVISQIVKYEKENNKRFYAITVHDSEDLVHPYELKMTNYLIDKHQAIQFPVFPLIKKPNFRNFFANITTNTYADEFAENHFLTMRNRSNMKALVPSAGTGFSLSRDLIDRLGDQVLPENNLTEDYKLSLSLYEKGIKMYYVLEKIKRIDFEGNLRTEYIATRSMFPNTFKTAVKQKTRWILGITMQSLKFRDIFNRDLSFVGRYSLYRDQKAKIGNLLSIIGYPVLIYFLASLFFDLQAIYPKYSLSWCLSFIVLILMLERQVFRAIALKKVYGWRSVFFGCLLPPLIPIRIIWGNLINFVATLKAYTQILRSKRKVKTYKKENAKKITWSKTKHSFLEKHILKRFHRRFGDELLSKQYISSETLNKVLLKKNEDDHLGKVLLELNLISEDQFLDALSSAKNILTIEKKSLNLYNLSKYKDQFEEKELIKMNMVPIFKSGEDYVFAYGTSAIISEACFKKDDVYDNKQIIIASDSCIKEAISLIYNDEKILSNDCYQEEDFIKRLDREEIVIIRNHASKEGISELEMAACIGSHYLQYE